MASIRDYKPLGKFTLTGDKLYASDPCYEKGSHCALTIPNALSGEWRAYVNVQNFPFSLNGEKHDDFRVSTLCIRHTSVPTNKCFNLVQSHDDTIRCYGKFWEFYGDCGVDSAQLGFYDIAQFGNNDLFPEEGKCGLGDKWYCNICDITLERKLQAGIIPYGVVSRTGFGDGTYTVLVHRNASGAVDAAMVCYEDDTGCFMGDY